MGTLHPSRWITRACYTTGNPIGQYIGISPMSLTTTIKAMLAAGCTAEQLASVVEAYELEQQEAIKARRAKRAAQKREERSRRNVSHDVAATESDNPSPSSPPLNGFPPNPHSRNIIPPFPIIPSSSPSPRSLRGSRLADSWKPSSDDLEFAKGLGVDGQLEADRFRDYWIGVAGDKGVKLNWSSTWRNWCRRAPKAEKPKEITFLTKPPKPYEPPPPTPEISPEERARRAAQVAELLKGFGGGHG